MKSITLKVGGATRSHLRDFPFLLKQATCALILFFKPIRSSCAQPSPSPKEATLLKLDLYVKDFGSYIWTTHGTTSQNKQCQPNKKPTYLEHKVFMYHFGPHGSGTSSCTMYSTAAHCHPVDRKPHQTIRRRPISSCMNI